MVKLAGTQTLPTGILDGQDMCSQALLINLEVIEQAKIFSVSVSVDNGHARGEIVGALEE